MSETPEDILRGYLTSVVHRGQTWDDLSARPMPSLARAMMEDAVRGLAEAFPDDRCYQDQWRMWQEADAALRAASPADVRDDVGE